MGVAVAVVPGVARAKAEDAVRFSLLSGPRKERQSHGCTCCCGDVQQGLSCCFRRRERGGERVSLTFHGRDSILRLAGLAGGKLGKLGKLAPPDDQPKVRYPTLPVMKALITCNG